MAHPHNPPRSARNHSRIPIFQKDPSTFQHGPGNPDLLNIGEFSNIPHGIYSSFPVGFDDVINPVPTGSVGNRGHGQGYLHGTPLDPSCQSSFEDSPGGRNDFPEPAAWLTTRTPLDRPPQESAEPAASSPNGRGADQQRSMRRTDNKSSSVTRVYQCKWQGCLSQTNFRRLADLLRHLKTIHIEPEAYPCPSPSCDYSFGRKDHLKQHVKRRH